MVEWILIVTLVVIGYSALCRMFYLNGRIAGFKRGHDQGYALARKHYDHVRNIEPVKPHEMSEADRAILAALLELDRSDRETIH